MPWDFEFCETFRRKAETLKPYQKQQVKEKLDFISELPHPKDDGGPYLGQWAYVFGGGHSFLLCKIPDEGGKTRFTNIIV